MQESHREKKTTRQAPLRAAALQYTSANSLPTVLSSGEGLIARKILYLAEEHGIPIHEDSSLAALLNQVPDGTDIPEMAFALLSEVLCFLYERDLQWREEHRFMADILGNETALLK